MQNKDLIQSKLEDGEHIIWEGKPNHRRIFAYSDIYMIPITFFLFLFILTQVIPNLSFDLGFVVFTNHMNQWDTKTIFLIPFLLVFFYQFIGRFINKIYGLKRTEYYLTNKRIFIYSNAFIKQVKKVEYKDNTRIYRSYTSVFGKPMVMHLDYIHRYVKVSAVKNIYGDIDIIFMESSLYIRKRIKLNVSNTKDAELLLDIIKEVKEDARYSKFKKADSTRMHGKIHYL